MLANFWRQVFNVAAPKPRVFDDANSRNQLGRRFQFEATFDVRVLDLGERAADLNGHK